MVQVGRRERSMELRFQVSPEKVLILEASSLRKRVEPGTVPQPQCPASIWRINIFSMYILSLYSDHHSGLRARGAGEAKGSLEVVGYKLLGEDAPCLL